MKQRTSILQFTRKRKTLVEHHPRVTHSAPTALNAVGAE